jgi:sugar O-acyltransferase (sialic acid O-acetyltransferase NeuD family)
VPARASRFRAPRAAGAGPARTVRPKGTARAEYGDDRHVVVLGGGGHARVVIDVLRRSSCTVLSVFDDTPASWDREVLGIRVVGPLATLARYRRFFGVIAIGDNAARRRIAQALPRGEWVRAVHPASVVADPAALGPGVVVMAGAVVQPGASVGAHAIVNTMASIDHDCRLGAFSHVAPGAHLGGAVVVEEGAFVGMGAVLAPRVRVGRWSTVGAGSLVLRHVPAGSVAYGRPARAADAG